MNLIEILGIIGIHWIADFVLQNDKMAQGKSKNWNDLLSHTSTYSLVWFVTGVSLCITTDVKAVSVIWFWAITFISHTATDYCTSRVNSKLWEDKKVHQFFVSIGFDQCLHYTQLFLTYWYLFKYH